MKAFRSFRAIPLAAFAALLAAPLTASAQSDQMADHPGGPPHPGHHGAHPPGRGPFWDFFPVPPGVTLTDAQKAQFHQLFQAAEESSRELREKAHALHEQIHEALTTEGDLDRHKLDDLAHQFDELKAQESHARLELEEKLHDLLTPAQRHAAKETAGKIRALQGQIDVLIGRGPGPGPEGEPPPPGL